MDIYITTLDTKEFHGTFSCLFRKIITMDLDTEHVSN